jgi:hypothetical protein
MFFPTKYKREGPPPKLNVLDELQMLKNVNVQPNVARTVQENVQLNDFREAD